MSIKEKMMADDYVVKGVDSKGTPMFYALDDASGGYPYGSAYSPAQTSDLTKAIGWVEDASRNISDMHDIKVCRIVYEEVDVSAHVKELAAAKAMLNTLTAAQKALLKKML